MFGALGHSGTIASPQSCLSAFTDTAGASALTKRLKGSALMDLVVRFLVGGAIVSLFALIGDVLKPKGFAGLFGAAPSVALATLGLTIATHGKLYAAIEARSMVAGAAAFLLYALSCVYFIGMRQARASLFIRASFSSRGIARSSVSRSARVSSVSIVSMSRMGSTLPSTWMTSRRRTADDVEDGVDLADVGEELVAQPLALAGPRTIPAMSTTRTAAGMIFSADELADDVRAARRAPDDADVGLDGGERVVRGQRALRGQGVEKGALADVGQTDDPDGESHEGEAYPAANPTRPRAESPPARICTPCSSLHTSYAAQTRTGCADPSSAQRIRQESRRRPREGQRVRGTDQLARRVHRQQGQPDVDGPDAERGGRDRSDRRPARDGVVGHELLDTHPDRPARPSPGRRSDCVGRVALVRIELQQGTLAEQRMVGGVVASRVVRVDRVTGVDGEARRSRVRRGAGRRAPHRGRTRSDGGRRPGTARRPRNGSRCRPPRDRTPRAP